MESCTLLIVVGGREFDEPDWSFLVKFGLEECLDATLFQRFNLPMRTVNSYTFEFARIASFENLFATLATFFSSIVLHEVFGKKVNGDREKSLTVHHLVALSKFAVDCPFLK